LSFGAELVAVLDDLQGDSATGEVGDGETHLMRSGDEVKVKFLQKLGDHIGTCRWH
jgi:hypothetical protein